MKYVLALLVAAFVLAGCAVTRIDVDVYKGPLANHEDVQLEQFRVMAVGAKHLLIRLRDELEWPDPKSKPPRPLYREDYMPSFGWTNDDAARVNNVLSLYHDTTPQGLEFYARKSLPAYRAFADAYAVLSASRNPELFRRFARDFKVGADPALREGYAQLLDARRDPHDSRRVALIAAADRRQFASVGSNYVYGRLANEDVVQSHANILFADPKGVVAQEFVHTVSSMGRAYLAARQNLEDVWLASTQALRVINSPSSHALSSGEVHGATSRLADLVAFLTDVGLLDDYFCSVPGSRFQTVVTSHSTGQNPWVISGRMRDFRRAELSLASALKAEPVRVSAELEEAHSFIKRGLLSANCRGSPETGSLREIRYRFGLARSPTGDVADESGFLPFEPTDALYRTVTAGSAGGLERGRLPEGIESLVDRAIELKRRARGRTVNELEREAMNDLIDALVQFATKVLTVANHDELFRKTGNAPPASGQAYDLEKINSFILVLQAVGNSIIVQADELRHQESHRDRLKDPTRIAAEMRALEGALLRTGNEYVTNLLNALRQDLTRANSAVTAATTAKQTATNAHGTHADPVRLAGDAKTQADAAVTAADNELTAERQKLANVSTAVTALSRDRGKLLADRFGTGTTTVSATALIGELVTEIRPFSTVAADYLDGIKASTGIPDGERNAVFGKVVEFVRKRQEFGQTFVTDADNKLQAAKTQQTAAANTQRTATAAQQTAQGLVAQRQNELDSATARRNALRALVDFVDQQQADVLKRATAADASASARTVHTLLVARLSDAIATEEGKGTAGTEAAARLKSAAQVLASRNPPPDAGRVTQGTSGENARDVLDRMIALLRHEHILAVREGGADSERAKSLNEAINAAYEHRSGMAYIRPASAYLRTSYAATSLQNDPGLAWQNMLSRHGLRSLPFFSEAATNYGQERKQEIVAEIDKQFWQNINSVRVAGGGFTNYVMAKDDIGNWYVKAYSADPRAVINSAKGLALFNLGAAANTNLLGRLKSEEARAAGEAAPATGDGSPLDRIYSKYRTAYTEQTKTDFTSALALDKQMRERITAAWTSNTTIPEPARTQAGAHLTVVMDDLKRELDGIKDVPENDRGRRIVGIAQSGRRAYLALASKIELDATILATETMTAPEIRRSLRAEAARVSNAVLSDLLGRRQTTAGDFEQAVLFIGEARQ